MNWENSYVPVTPLQNMIDCITSTQALNEFSNVCLKKLRMPVEVIQQSIDEIVAAYEITLVDHDVIKKALDLHRKYGYSYYDLPSLRDLMVKAVL